MMCMFLLVLLIFGFSTRHLAEPDIWWHLRNASNLLEHNSLSGIDTYTFTAAGSPWISFEWLSEAPILSSLQS